MKMKLYFIVVFVLLILGTAGLDCRAQTVLPGDDWRNVTRCHFSFDIPGSLQESTDRSAGSCVTGFNGTDLFVQMDYGYNSAPSDKDKWTRDYKLTSTTIGGKRARVITYRSVPVVGGRQEPVDWVTEVHIVTSAATRKHPLGSSLLLTITSTNPAQSEAIRRIYTSLRFKA